MTNRPSFSAARWVVSQSAFQFVDVWAAKNSPRPKTAHKTRTHKKPWRRFCSIFIIPVEYYLNIPLRFRSRGDRPVAPIFHRANTQRPCWNNQVKGGENTRLAKAPEKASSKEP